MNASPIILPNLIFFLPLNMAFNLASGYSKFMSLLNMQDKISDAMDKNEYSIGIFLDLAKAFDTTDLGILLKKLSIYGIRNIQLNWFKSYLENRMQLVSSVVSI